MSSTTELERGFHQQPEAAQPEDFPLEAPVLRGLKQLTYLASLCSTGAGKILRHHPTHRPCFTYEENEQG